MSLEIINVFIGLLAALVVGLLIVYLLHPVEMKEMYKDVIAFVKASVYRRSK